MPDTFGIIVEQDYVNFVVGDIREQFVYVVGVENYTYFAVVLVKKCFHGKAEQ